MNTAIVIFTKVPNAGEVKTRLTEARGGILTYEEASFLYEACLLDVLEACSSVEQTEVYVCYNMDGDRKVLDSLLLQLNNPQKIKGVFHDEGGRFDECMQFAADFIFKSKKDARLVDAVLIIGGDLPTLQPKVIEDAINKIETLSNTSAGRAVAINSKDTENPIGACLVEGADQEGGFNIVGLTYSTPFDFRKVFYNMEGITALDMLVNKAMEEKIPYGVVETVPDIDTPTDLASCLPVLRSLELAALTDSSYFVPRNVLACLREIGLQSFALPPEGYDE